MPESEDRQILIDREWEALQLDALRMANHALRHDRRAVKPYLSIEGQAIVCAVIGTFTPQPVGVDDFIAGLAIAKAQEIEEAEDADAVQSPSVFTEPAKS